MGSESLRIRDISEEDIPLILNYWFNPDNLKYHQRRGTFGEEQLKLFQNQGDVLLEQAKTPQRNRKGTTAIIELNACPIGHIHLNDIRDDEKRRVHFHPWPNSRPNEIFGQAIGLGIQYLSLSIDYFVQTFGVPELIGDVAIENKFANFCMKKAGYSSMGEYKASYLGYEGNYHRYRLWPKLP